MTAFQLLEKTGNTGGAPNIEELNRQVKKMFALPDVEADGSLQVMTIYKAKGLEFDTVIVPGLGRAPRADDTKLLHWLEHGLESGGSDLLLAPISAEGSDKNVIETYLQQIDKTKGHYENGRLLYVAATRAKRDLHLLGHTSLKENDGELSVNTPSKNSLLESLWPVLEKDFLSY